MLQAALNGNREHPAAPRTPSTIAAQAAAAVAAGARSVHLHPYDENGDQTLAAGPGAGDAAAGAGGLPRYTYFTQHIGCN